MSERPPPPGWGDDSLTEFLNLAQSNRWATFANKKPIVSKLIGIDACFMRAEGHLSRVDELTASMLLIRSHASYRAACAHAMAGEVVEAFGDIRTCLESAAYAARIGRNLGVAEIWLRRHDSPEADAIMRKTFAAKQLKAAISKSNRKAAEVFEALYQRSIDSGAHPNERAISSSLKIQEGKKTIEFQQLQLHADGIQLDHALKSTAQCGVCALEICQGIFNARFELLGINSSLLDLRKNL